MRKENAEKKREMCDRSAKISDFDNCMRESEFGRKRKVGEERFLWEKMGVGIFLLGFFKIF